MHFQHILALTALAGTALASPVELQERAQSCTNGAVVYIVRGSDPNHPGLDNNPNPLGVPNSMIDTAKALVSKYGGYYSGIQYPATMGYSANYEESKNRGIYALQGAINDYIRSCPNGKIYVLGYSQGGQVTSGALGGSSVAGPVDDRGRIHGAVAFADPTFVDGISPIDQGSGANNGRNGISAGNGSKYKYLAANFAQRFRSYCEANDNVCDSGSDSGAIHGRSPDTFAAASRNFMLNAP